MVLFMEIDGYNPPRTINPNVGASDELIKVIFDVEPTLNMIEKEFSGLTYDKIAKKYVKYREPMLNEKGLSRLMAYIRGLINPILKGTDFDKETILMLSEEIYNELVYMIGANQIDWEIDPTEMSTIHNIVWTNALAVLNSAKNFASVDAMSGTTKRTEVVNRNEYPGLAGRVKF